MFSTQAVPAVLSMGCNNKCEFCPTSKIFKGKIFFGDPEKILPHYENMNVHFLDENFFHNDMDTILPLLKKYNIKWLAMAHYEDVMEAYNRYGEDYLYDCGLRIVEVGLENIALMRKVPGDGVPNKKVEIFYLNLTFLPNETKSSIQETAEWMQTHSLKNPIYHYNGMWYSPGQYYYPYGKPEPDGVLLNTELARVVPTYIPNSFLNEEVEIVDKDLVNKYVHLVTSKNNLFYPIIFDEDTPCELISKLQPSIIYKGSEYSNKKIPELETIKNLDCEIRYISQVKQKSSSAIIERMYENIND